MKTQIYNNSADMLETLFQEFNGNTIYGLEYILDEFQDSKEGSKYTKDGPPSTDWFGFSDLCM